MCTPFANQSIYLDYLSDFVDGTTPLALASSIGHSSHSKQNCTMPMTSDQRSAGLMGAFLCTKKTGAERIITIVRNTWTNKRIWRGDRHFFSLLKHGFIIFFVHFGSTLPVTGVQVVFYRQFTKTILVVNAKSQALTTEILMKIHW